MLESLDNGKPFAVARAADVPLSVDMFRYMAGGRQDRATTDLRDPPGEYLIYTMREPVGVVGQIIPSEPGAVAAALGRRALRPRPSHPWGRSAQASGIARRSSWRSARGWGETGCPPRRAGLVRRAAPNGRGRAAQVDGRAPALAELARAWPRHYGSWSAALQAADLPARGLTFETSVAERVQATRRLAAAGLGLRHRGRSRSRCRLSATTCGRATARTAVGR